MLKYPQKGFEEQKGVKNDESAGKHEHDMLNGPSSLEGQVLVRGQGLGFRIQGLGLGIRLRFIRFWAK